MFKRLLSGSSGGLVTNPLPTNCVRTSSSSEALSPFGASSLLKRSQSIIFPESNLDWDATDVSIDPFENQSLKKSCSLSALSSHYRGFCTLQKPSKSVHFSPSNPAFDESNETSLTHADINTLKTTRAQTTRAPQTNVQTDPSLASDPENSGCWLDTVADRNNHLRINSLKVPNTLVGDLLEGLDSPERESSCPVGEEETQETDYDDSDAGSALGMMSIDSSEQVQMKEVVDTLMDELEIPERTMKVSAVISTLQTAAFKLKEYRESSDLLKEAKRENHSKIQTYKEKLEAYETKVSVYERLLEESQAREEDYVRKLNGHKQKGETMEVMLEERQIELDALGTKISEHERMEAGWDKKKQEYETSMKDSQTKIYDYERKVHEYQDQIQDYKTKAQESQTTLEEYLLKIAEYQAKLKDHDDKIQLLADATHQNSYLQQENTDLGAQNITLSAERNHLQEELQKLGVINETMSNKNHDLETKQLLQSITKDIFQQQMNEIEKCLASKYPQTGKITQRIEKLVDDNDRLMKDSMELITTNAALTDSIEGLEAEIVDLHFELDVSREAQNDLDLLFNMIKTSQKLETETTSDLLSRSNEIVSLQSQLKQKTQELSKVEHECTKLQRSNMEAIEENMELERTKKQIHIIHKELHDKTENLLQEIRGLEENMAAKEKEVKVISELSNSLKGQSEQQEIKINSLCVQLESETNNAKELEDKLNGYLQTIDRINQEKVEIISNNNYYIAKYNELSEVLKEQKRYIQQTQTANENLDQSFNMAQLSNNIIIKFYNELIQKCQDSLRSMLYQDSIVYLESLHSSFAEKQYFHENHMSLLREINSFIAVAISDLVSSYLKNESILEHELVNKQRNYDQMLRDLSEKMIQKLTYKE
ncbi:hypothetical protein PSN45_001393 [Yamadazyma tenuis]|uniref:uncharacterized protein n=1 Tax=Candida tenuis TaxID=2315449 RepID=UPI0027A036D8|nr:hypothetical protein PSN45_001393 [Yamadazyma tenuis]